MINMMSNIACPVGADFTSALTTPTGLNVYKNKNQQSGTTPLGSNIFTAFIYKYMTPLGSCKDNIVETWHAASLHWTRERYKYMTPTWWSCNDNNVVETWHAASLHWTRVYYKYMTPSGLNVYRLNIYRNIKKHKSVSIKLQFHAFII